MIKLAWYDDGKKKCNSFEVFCKEESFHRADLGIYSSDPLEIVGYGATKEEAIADFTQKLEWVVKEWNAVLRLITETDYFERQGMVEVNCWGKEIN